MTNGIKKNVYTKFDSNYFQAIQTAIFHKKNTSKMFKCNFVMFLDLQGSWDQNKKKVEENCLSKSSLRYLIG